MLRGVSIMITKIFFWITEHVNFLLIATLSLSLVILGVRYHSLTQEIAGLKTELLTTKISLENATSSLKVQEQATDLAQSKTESINQLLNKCYLQQKHLNQQLEQVDLIMNDATNEENINETSNNYTPITHSQMVKGLSLVNQQFDLFK